MTGGDDDDIYLIAAHVATDRIVYDAATGNIFHDADGSARRPRPCSRRSRRRRADHADFSAFAI